MNVIVHTEPHSDCAYCAAGVGVEHDPEPMRSLAEIADEYDPATVSALAEIPWRF